MIRNAILTAVALALTGAAHAAPACQAPKGDQTQAVAAAARDLFAAAQIDDAAAFKAGVTADFYAYDNGKRFDGMALFDLIKAAHAQGRRFVWTVQEPKVVVACDTAFLAYVNHGAVGDAKGMQPIIWLESDYLRFEQGRWKIAFLHSTRAAPPAAP
jgi:ketosteroid isomerase-like protein